MKDAKPSLKLNIFLTSLLLFILSEIIFRIESGETIFNFPFINPNPRRIAPYDSTDYIIPFLDVVSVLLCLLIILRLKRTLTNTNWAKSILIGTLLTVIYWGVFIGLVILLFSFGGISV